jgi:hypothetical protein
LLLAEADVRTSRAAEKIEKRKEHRFDGRRDRCRRSVRRRNRAASIGDGVDMIVENIGRRLGSLA